MKSIVTKGSQRGDTPLEMLFMVIVKKGKEPLFQKIKSGSRN